MTTVGAIFMPLLPPERLRSVAVAADEAGLEELWLWEDCFREGGMASAAAALAWTSRLRVGVGVFPVPLRNVAITAMEVAALARMFGDRAVIGLGHGVTDWMAQVGAAPKSPMTLLREYTAALSALLAGERLTVDGTYVHLDGVALDWPPADPPPLHLAAVGPKTLALAGAVADGTVLSGGATPDDVRRAVALAADARAAAGRSGRHRIAVYVPVVSGEDAAARLAADRVHWEDPASGYAGDADSLAAALREYVEAGADRIICQPMAGETDPESFVRFVATELAPRVRGA